MSSSLQETIRSDFLSFDGLETIAYFSRVDEVPNFEPVLGYEIQAFGTRGTDQDERMFARLAPGRSNQIFHFLKLNTIIIDEPDPTPDTELEVTLDVRPRDKLTQEDGTEWEIIWVQLQSLSQRYRCHCVKMQA